MLHAGRPHDRDHSAIQDERDRTSPQRHGPSLIRCPSARKGEREYCYTHSTDFFCITRVHYLNVLLVHV